ncbi:MAG: hypothetical protein CBC21_07365 [Proteobacteria bacterium TMED61]|nr:MAG: hypothetical protein CBC21_07365 [Proteobacteria bacterium TMED61]
MRQDATKQTKSVMNQYRVGICMVIRHAIVILTICLGPAAMAQLIIGEAVPTVVLNEENGGLVGGGPWSNASLNGKVNILMYVDPDKVKVNAHVEDALAAESFDRDKVASVAVINMAATWKPNFAIDMLLQKKQEKYPDTLYVRDLRRVLVDAWGLVDNGYHVLVVGRNGEVLFSAANALSETQVAQLISTINRHSNPE